MSRLEWILTGILLLLLLFIGWIGWIWWQQTSRPPTVLESTARPVVHVAQTAKTALPLAVARAESWAADAQLVTVSGDWTIDNSLIPSAGSWRFVFYSEQNNRLALITIVGEHATFIGEAKPNSTIRPIEVSDWQIDSDEALEIILSVGGQLFIEENGVVNLYWEVINDPPLTWKSSLRNREADKQLRVWLDTQNGSVLLLEQRP